VTEVQAQQTTNYHQCDILSFLQVAPCIDS